MSAPPPSVRRYGMSQGREGRPAKTRSSPMRVMVVVKASPESEAGALPDPKLIAEMGKFNDELIAAGLMVDGAGLQSSAKAKRVKFSDRGVTVMDGPFAETKELIAGYWILNVKDMAEAVDWIRRAPMQDTELDIRPYFEPEDFAGIATPELIEQEKGWREAQLANAPRA
jgi:hypothetical protein